MPIEGVKRCIECVDNDVRQGFEPEISGISAVIFGDKNVPVSWREEMQGGGSAGGASGMRQYVKLEILAMLVMRRGLAALSAPSVCVAGSSQQDDILLRIDSGASNHLCQIFHCFTPLMSMLRTCLSVLLREP